MIELRQITKIYGSGPKRNVIFDHFDFCLEPGEFVMLYGRSGCGKSTLLNIVGLIDSVTGGTYMLDNVDVSTLNRRELSKLRNEKIGYVFQRFYLLPDETLENNVALPLQYAGIGKAERRERAHRLLTEVGMNGREKDYPAQLSGGEMQRVAIARALVNNPPYLLADEPTGNLDAENRDRIMQLFKQIHTHEGTGILMVTHDLELLQYADRVVHLDG